MRNSTLILFLAILFSVINLSAQDYGQKTPVFKKGRIDAQVGIGLTSTFIGDRGTMTKLFLFRSLYWIAGKKLSLGAYAAHSVTERAKEIVIDGLIGHSATNHINAPHKISCKSHYY